MPTRAEVVVIGGGVIGCSIAYHLAVAGVRDVLLVDAGQLGGGSTCKAAGGVRASFSDPVNIAMGLRGLEVYARFGEDHGQDVDFKRNGYLYCLTDEDAVAALAESVALRNSYGVPIWMVDPDEAARLSPLISTDGMLAAAWSPNDARATPEAVVSGYARSTRRHGATLLTDCRVLEIQTRGGAVCGVVTSAGVVETRAVVCAAGAWSAQIGAMVGVPLPVTPSRRTIAFTGPVPDAPPGAPLTVDLPSTFYFHPEGAGVAFGWSDPYEPTGFDLTVELDGWLERVAPFIARRAPRLLDCAIATAWTGLYEVTPDHNQIIGRAADVDGFLYATGFSGHGFLMAPATGEIVRDLYLGREPGYDIGGLDVRRFDAASQTRSERNII